MTEFQQVSLGLSYQRAELLASSSSTEQSQDWVLNNGNPFIEDTGTGFQFFGTKFDTVELQLGWSFDSRNRALFANRGTRQQLFFAMAVPGSDVEYYQARYNYTKYIPIFGRWVGRINAELGISEAMGDTTATPPFKQFYGGGPSSVRGFKESYLGPRDSFGNPYGGNAMVASQLELIIPLPEKWSSQARASIFYDIGNVFNTDRVQARRG